MPKSEKEPKVTRVKHNRPVKVTSDDVPGSGMAKKAAKGIEAYRKRQREAMDY
jgi:hypothetical protein